MLPRGGVLSAGAGARAGIDAKFEAFAVDVVAEGFHVGEFFIDVDRAIGLAQGIGVGDGRTGSGTDRRSPPLHLHFDFPSIINVDVLKAVIRKAALYEAISGG